MCEQTTTTSIISFAYITICILIPLVYLFLYAKKKTRRRKKYAKAFAIAIVLFILPFSVKMIIKLNGDKMMCANCYINNICKTKEEIKLEEKKEKETSTVEIKTTTTETTTSTTETTTTKASSNPTYNKLNEISGTRVDKGLTSKGYQIYEINGITYIDGYLIANKTYHLPSDYVPTDTYKSAVGVTNTCNECINNTVLTAWKKMAADAQKEGIYLRIGSGYRSYNTQKNIYNNYVARDGQEQADTYSARPGSSEHQTAICFDVCGSNLSSDKCISSKFNDTAEAKWIDANASKYGFIIRYPKNKMDETGYKYESWHIRYVGKELANKLYNNGDWITMESYFGITSKYE